MLGMWAMERLGITIRNMDFKDLSWELAQHSGPAKIVPVALNEQAEESVE